VHVAEGLVDQVEVEVVEPKAPERPVDRGLCALVAGILHPQLGRDEQVFARADSSGGLKNEFGRPALRGPKRKNRLQNAKSAAPVSRATLLQLAFDSAYVCAGREGAKLALTDIRGALISSAIPATPPSLLTAACTKHRAMKKPDVCRATIYRAIAEGKAKS
jgi:hypothetical protein